MTQQPEERSLRVSAHFEPFSEPGTTVKGTYQGCRMIPFNTDTGVLPQYGIMTSEGFTVFNGTYSLNEVLPGLPVGIKIQVTYKGTQKARNGFNVKDFEVRVVGDDVDRVLEHFPGFALPQPDNTRFLKPGITIDPVTGEIQPTQEDEEQDGDDNLPF